MVSAPPFTHGDLKRFVPEARRTIAFARILTWKVRWANADKKLAVLHSPKGEKELHIPTTNINYKRARSWMTQMMRYSDPTDVMNLLEGGFDMRTEPDIAQLVATYGVELKQQVEQWEREDNQKVAIEALRVIGETTMADAMRAAQEQAATKEDQSQQRAPDESPGVTERTVVSKVPWLAHRSGKKGGRGRMYESTTTSQVTFDDGTTTYQCNYCEYMNDKPRAVAIHAGKNHPDITGQRSVEVKDSEKPKPRRRGKDEPSIIVENYQPTDEHRRPGIRRLANDIVKALDGIEAWQSMEVTELAQQVAEAVVANRPEHGAGEPLTDEQVLRRIEALVDRGRLADMHRQVENLTEQLRLVVTARDEAESRADRLYGERKALRDMLAEEES